MLAAVDDLLLDARRLPRLRRRTDGRGGSPRRSSGPRETRDAGREARTAPAPPTRASGAVHLRAGAPLVPRPADGPDRRLQHAARRPGSAARSTSTRSSGRCARSCGGTTRSGRTFARPTAVRLSSRSSDEAATRASSTATLRRGRSRRSRAAGWWTSSSRSRSTSPAARSCAALLVRVGADEHVLELVFDHIDLRRLVARRHLRRAWRSCTTAYRRGRGRDLPAPRIQYDDHARGERARLTDERRRAEARVLARPARRHPGCARAADRPTAARHAELRGRHAAHHLDAARLAATIRAFARAEGATLFATLLAVYDVLLHRYAGQETIVVGSTSPPATAASSSDGVGLFASTVALARRPRATTRRSATLRRAGPADGAGGGRAPGSSRSSGSSPTSQPERDLSRHPIFQVFFAHVPETRLAIDGASRSTRARRRRAST